LFSPNRQDRLWGSAPALECVPAWGGRGRHWTRGTTGYSVRLAFRRNSIFLFWTAVCLLNLILDHNGQPRMDLQPLVCMKTCIRK